MNLYLCEAQIFGATKLPPLSEWDDRRDPAAPYRAWLLGWLFGAAEEGA